MTDVSRAARQNLSTSRLTQRQTPEWRIDERPAERYSPPIGLDARVVALRLRNLREQQGLSLQQLAKKAGLSQRHLKKLEAGQAQPQRPTLRKLAKALKVTVAELVE